MKTTDARLTDNKILRMDVNFLAVVISVLLLDLNHFAPHTVMGGWKSARGGTKPFCAAHGGRKRCLRRIARSMRSESSLQESWHKSWYGSS
jgi:hypothetical protein